MIRLTVILVIVMSCTALLAQEATPEATPEMTAEAPIVLVELPEVDPISVRGNISIAGSSTVFPLTERIIQRFEADGYTDTISEESIGTGAGFERFCVAGDTDIANASRPIRQREIDNCLVIGREPVELRVGTDALVVVVSQQNDFVEDLTLEELALAFSTAQTWQDVRPEFPDEPILRFTPGTESGTFDFFVEVVLGNDEAPLLAAANLQLSEDDNVLVRGVESSPFAVGFFGFAYYLENREFLRAIAINGVTPNEISAEDGTYKLARPLFVYTAPSVLAEKPQVAAFLIYYLTHVNEEVLDVGYFPASDAALNQARQNLLDALEQ
ncbi:MAG: PstS family phosphate ABC transporter substrate-binding protein [Anaerolineae bacterium]